MYSFLSSEGLLIGVQVLSSVHIFVCSSTYIHNYITNFYYFWYFSKVIHTAGLGANCWLLDVQYGNCQVTSDSCVSQTVIFIIT